MSEMFEGNLLINDGGEGEKVGMVWPAQKYAGVGAGVGEGVGEGEMSGVGAGGNEERRSQSPMMMVNAPVQEEQQQQQQQQAEGDVAGTQMDTTNWLKGSKLYSSLLSLLLSWGVENSNFCTVFDRLDDQVLQHNIGTFEILNSLCQYKVCEDEMIVFALALMRKLIIKTGLPITNRNNNHVFLACLSLANKMMSDTPFGVACFDQLARVRKGNFKKYETILLLTFGWSLEIEQEEVQKAHDMLL